MTTHSPAPWILNGDVIVDVNGQPIAANPAPDTADGEARWQADAPVLAAVPLLLEAVKEAIGEVEDDSAAAVALNNALMVVDGRVTGVDVDPLERRLRQMHSDLDAAIADRNTATARLQEVDEKLCGALNQLAAEKARADDSHVDAMEKNALAIAATRRADDLSRMVAAMGEAGRKAHDLLVDIDLNAGLSDGAMRIVSDLDAILSRPDVAAERGRWVSWTDYETTAAERDAAIDCGQVDVCAKPPGCQRHWAERNAELVRERDVAIARAESAELGCDIAYRREPTQEEGDAHEDKQHQSMGPELATGECFVAMGGWTGRRCRHCGWWVWGGPTVCVVCVERAERDEWKARAEKAEAMVEKLTTLAEKVDVIRNSIVGMQGFNFSEHGYPLVAALEAAGFRGVGYEIARKNLGTLIEQRDAAIARAETLQADLTRVEMAHVVEMGKVAEAERQRDEWKERAEKAEAFASVRGGEWCAKNRAEGRGGCGACAWCCQQANQSRDSMRGERDRAIRSNDEWMARATERADRAERARDELGIQLAACQERLRLVMETVDALSMTVVMAAGPSRAREARLEVKKVRAALDAVPGDALATSTKKDGE